MCSYFEEIILKTELRVVDTGNNIVLSRYRNACKAKPNRQEQPEEFPVLQKNIRFKLIFFHRNLYFLYVNAIIVGCKLFY